CRGNEEEIETAKFAEPSSPRDNSLDFLDSGEDRHETRSPPYFGRWSDDRSIRCLIGWLGSELSDTTGTRHRTIRAGRCDRHHRAPHLAGAVKTVRATVLC